MERFVSIVAYLLFSSYSFCQCVWMERMLRSPLGSFDVGFIVFLTCKTLDPNAQIIQRSKTACDGLGKCLTFAVYIIKTEIA